MSTFWQADEATLEDFEIYPNADFRTKSSLVIEIGPGRGDFLFSLGETRPQETIVAIEYKPKRYYKLIERIEKRKLSNVSLILGNARWVIPAFFGAEQFKEVYILHPDPWPKTKHAKHRLIQAPFLEYLAEKMEPNGLVQVQTDDAAYGEQIQAVFESLSEPKKKRLYKKQEDPLPERAVKTHFEEKMKDKKLHTFNYLRTK